MSQNWHFWSIWARPCRLLQCPVSGSVGGCGARAVSRKTPIYFMLKSEVSVLVDEGCCQDHVSYLMLLAVGGRVRMGIFIQLMLVMTHGGLCH